MAMLLPDRSFYPSPKMASSWSRRATQGVVQPRFVWAAILLGTGVVCVLV